MTDEIPGGRSIFAYDYSVEIRGHRGDELIVRSLETGQVVFRVAREDVVMVHSYDSEIGRCTVDRIAIGTPLERDPDRRCAVIQLSPKDDAARAKADEVLKQEEFKVTMVKGADELDLWIGRKRVGLEGTPFPPHLFELAT